VRVNTALTSATMAGKVKIRVRRRSRPCVILVITNPPMDRAHLVVIAYQSGLIRPQDPPPSR
jgi:hypothetical protein